MINVYVKSEFASLKRVVMAQSEFAFPSKEDLSDEAFLTEETRDLYKGKDILGKNYKEVFPERQKEWEEERKNLKKVLEKYNVEVTVPRMLTVYEKEIGKEDGYSNFFVRDPFFTIGHFLIEGSLRFPHRRNEVLPVRNILATESDKDSCCLYLSIPKPDISKGQDSEDGPFLEGGDVLVLDKTIFVGRSGLASNENGISWLSNLGGSFGYEVVEVPLHETILHLDCAISLVREGLMIVCKEALLNGIPEQFKDWDKIYVTLEDASRLATNGLPINENVYITDPEFKFIGDELRKRGMKVEYIDFKISRSFGGSFRCSTQPLLRMDD
ncbi:dimethylarginine dimethylaminohydrolase family protein [Enterococcus casseliflavus]|uniref:dimethylarginine dimethylaminohydrolase family protein n=1 Tax=Enterococcus casseliflavus TaxID=37734 RepID=UPI0018838DCE|nr:arginine deiminase family protein [Enterococcus casseliflavus]MBE9909329.1 amidinotransferase [Enterococcus casseliflavus]